MSSSTTSSARRCSPRRRLPPCWPGTPGPQTRPPPTQTPTPARPWLTGAGAPLRRFVASDAILLATRAAALAAELDDTELGGRALVERGRANDAAAHFRAAVDGF